MADDLEWNNLDFAPPDSHVDWYSKWFTAQIIAYEKARPKDLLECKAQSDRR